MAAGPRKNSPGSTRPPAFPRKNSPGTPQTTDFGPFFVRWANFFALTPTIRPSRANFLARADVGLPVHYPSATGPRRCGGRRRARRARLRCPWAAKAQQQDPRAAHFRYKTLPAHPKWPNSAQSTHAGRVLYRFAQQNTEQGEFCTEREADIELANTTTLQAPQV